MDKRKIFGGYAILASNNFNSRPIVVQGTGIIKAGSPLTSAGAVALDGTNAVGILLSDVDTATNRNGAIIYQGMVNYEKAKESAGITATAATLESTIKGIHFVTGAGVNTSLSISSPFGEGYVGGTFTATLSNGVGTITVASSNTGVATASESSGTLTVTPVAIGSATITATDAVGNFVKLYVTVYNTSLSASTLSISGTASETLTVSGGKAPYTVASSATSKATATIDGTTITVTGVASGSSNVTVTDALGDTATCAVTVS